MRCRESHGVLGRIASGCRPRRRTFIVVIAAVVLLPVEASHAGWLSIFSMARRSRVNPQDRASRRSTPPRPSRPLRRSAQPRQSVPPRPGVKCSACAPGPVQIGPAASSRLRPGAIPQSSGSFWMWDMIAESEGAISARNVLSLSTIAGSPGDRGEAEGCRFAETKLLLTEAKRDAACSSASMPPTTCARTSCCRSTTIRCPASSSRSGSSASSRFSDRFSGYSVFVLPQQSDYIEFRLC